MSKNESKKNRAVHGSNHDGSYKTRTPVLASDYITMEE